MDSLKRNIATKVAGIRLQLQQTLHQIGEAISPAPRNMGTSMSFMSDLEVPEIQEEFRGSDLGIAPFVEIHPQPSLSDGSGDLLNAQNHIQALEVELTELKGRVSAQDKEYLKTPLFASPADRILNKACMIRKKALKSASWKIYFRKLGVL